VGGEPPAGESAGLTDQDRVYPAPEWAPHTLFREERSMPIKVTCTNCGGVLHAPDDAAGKRGRCPTCGTVLTIAEDAPRVPAQSAVPPPAASGPLEAASRAVPYPLAPPTPAPRPGPGPGLTEASVGIPVPPRPAPEPEPHRPTAFPRPPAPAPAHGTHASQMPAAYASQMPPAPAKFSDPFVRPGVGPVPPRPGLGPGRGRVPLPRGRRLPGDRDR